ncbi:putative ABC transport system permease protein [Plasticicumulans lactativorans]|uniref:Putative ABC transport system permease protein n=1 Tax=Plasticicumulans lactativorans TaxID=1133106 RepID=A0A4R2L816_9GAMM|nr:FtsX-like permease family protein [Plasticicumulans lactativorans]TCO83696.1 putative ABC transport system permease protein [Plasticicumulans lactativorans]
MRTTVLRLAWADYRGEARLSACAVLGLAAVLAPLLVLFGLRFGLVATLTERLLEDPRTRELIPIGSGRYDAAWFEALRARPEVAFVVPRTRQIAATADLRAASGPAVTVELLPSAPGDPLLARYGVTPPAAAQEVVLSRTAADKLGLAAGAEVDAAVGRSRAGREEIVRTRLRLTAVLPLEGFDRDAAFVPLDLLLAAEDYRDGHAVPTLGWPGSERPAGERVYPGFRLYARDLDAVEPLRAHLVGLGLEVLTQAEAIANVRALSRNLGIVFAVIAGLGAAGYLASAAASSLAAVARKRRDLSLLRLLGLSTRGLLAFPLAQALFTGAFGSAAAFAFYAAAAAGINALFAASRGPGEYLCRLLPLHFAAALAATLAAVLLAALAGGWRATRIEPSEGWREV